MLISELEQTFHVQFDLLEIVDLRSVGIIRSILLEKGVSLSAASEAPPRQ
jgi:hypothetical protein